MNALQWADLLHPNAEWRKVYPIVGQHVRNVLASEPERDFSTIELADTLMRPAWIVDDAMEKAKGRLYKALRALAVHDLKSWCRSGPKQIRFGRPVTPLIWSAPLERGEICPVCGQTMKGEGK
jgi:hypothetical protein